MNRKLGAATRRCLGRHELLDTLPRPQQQPSLLFGVVRLLRGLVDDAAAFHELATFFHTEPDGRTYLHDGARATPKVT